MHLPVPIASLRNRYQLRKAQYWVKEQEKALCDNTSKVKNERAGAVEPEILVVAVRVDVEVAVKVEAGVDFVDEESAPVAGWSLTGFERRYVVEQRRGKNYCWSLGW